MNVFYDRERELAALNRSWEAPSAQFALLYGRRRVGKTYLVRHFLRDRPHAFFLASQVSLAESMTQLATSVLRAFPSGGYVPADLPTLQSILQFVTNAAKEHRVGLVLDEFQYLVEQDPSIPSRIQAWWDTDGLRSNVFLILCGSHLGLMARIGGPQAPLFGRFTFRYKLPPMDYTSVACFYANSDYTARDKLAAFAVLGGTPRYHAACDLSRSLAENICRLVLDPLGLFHNEPEVLLLSSQIRDLTPFNSALAAVANGCTKFNEIAQRTSVSSAQLAYYLRALTEMDWVCKEMPFGETAERRAVYRIADNFISFWYRFVSPNRSQMEVNDPEEAFARIVQPSLNEFIGSLAFEGICLQFVRMHDSALLGQKVTRAARYWSRDGSLEIDLVAELADGSYLFGECKWSSSPIGVSVYYSLRDKIALMQESYRRSVRYIIFSAAGFDDALRETAQRDGILLVEAAQLLA